MALLSILVPTWNRAGQLQRLLAGLAAEIGARDDVVVNVGDNASDDATPDVLREAAASAPWLTYRRHPENLGAAPNMAWLVEHAPESRYAWIFGDDDLIVPGRLAEVLDLLATEAPAWLFLPYSFEDEQGRRGEGVPEPGVVERYGSSGDLYRAYHHWLTFVSGSILRAGPFGEAARSIGTDSAYAGFLWAFAAGQGGPCVVAPRHAVRGSLDISWKSSLDTYLTVHVVDLYDRGVAAELTPEQFAATLDARYLHGSGVWALDMWRNVDVAHLVDAVRRFPGSRALRSYLWALAVERRDDSALPVLAEAARQTGAADEARALVDAGEAAFGAGDPPQAEERFRAAVAADPTLAPAWNNLAVVGFERGAFDALAAVENAVFVAPDDVDARLNRASILMAHADRDGAAADARHVLGLDPDNAAAQDLMRALGA